MFVALQDSSSREVAKYSAINAVAVKRHTSFDLEPSTYYKLVDVFKDAPIEINKSGLEKIKHYQSNRFYNLIEPLEEHLLLYAQSEFNSPDKLNEFLNQPFGSASQVQCAYDYVSDISINIASRVDNISEAVGRVFENASSIQLDSGVYIFDIDSVSPYEQSWEFTLSLSTGIWQSRIGLCNLNEEVQGLTFRLINLIEQNGFFHLSIDETWFTSELFISLVEYKCHELEYLIEIIDGIEYDEQGEISVESIAQIRLEIDDEIIELLVDYYGELDRDTFESVRGVVETAIDKVKLIERLPIVKEDSIKKVHSGIKSLDMEKLKGVDRNVVGILSAATNYLLSKNDSFDLSNTAYDEDECEVHLCQCHAVSLFNNEFEEQQLTEMEDYCNNTGEVGKVTLLLHDDAIEPLFEQLIFSAHFIELLAKITSAKEFFE